MKDVEKETNEFLIRRFVGCVGYDYKKNYSPHLWPDFSEDTVELWNEIESRLQAPTCLNFDRDAFQSTIKEEIEKQEKLLRGGPDYDTSYHYGIKSGLNFAWRIVEDNIRKAEEKSLEKNARKRKKSLKKVEEDDG